MFNSFADTPSRIDQRFIAAYAALDRDLGPGFQPLVHFLDHIVISRGLLHRFRRALQMHEDCAAAPVTHH